MDNLEIFGSEKFCSLKLENVSIEDHGTFMCLLNQADVFHTDQSYLELEIATRAQIKLRKKQSEEKRFLELVEGDWVDLVCEGKRAYPAPSFEWNVPGKESVLSMEVLFSGKDHFHYNLNFPIFSTMNPSRKATPSTPPPP